jgi:hypothetical protein
MAQNVKSEKKEPTTTVELTAKELAELSNALWEHAQIFLAMTGEGAAKEAYRAEARALRAKLIKTIEEMDDGSDQNPAS